MKFKIMFILLAFLWQQCIASKKEAPTITGLKMAFEKRPTIQKISKKQSDLAAARLEQELLKSHVNQVKDSMRAIHGQLKDIHADNFEHSQFKESWRLAKSHIDNLEAFFKKNGKLRSYIKSFEGQKDLKEEMSLLNNLNGHITLGVIADIEDWNKRRRLRARSQPALDKELTELEANWSHITGILLNRSLLVVPERIPISNFPRL